MGTLAHMKCCNADKFSSGSALIAKTKLIFRERNTIFFFWGGGGGGEVGGGGGGNFNP